MLFNLIAKPDIVLNTIAIFYHRGNISTAFSPAPLLSGTTMQFTRDSTVFSLFSAWDARLALHAGSYFSRRVCPYTKHNSIAHAKKKPTNCFRLCTTPFPFSPLLQMLIKYSPFLELPPFTAVGCSSSSQPPGLSSVAYSIGNGICQF